MALNSFKCRGRFLFSVKFEHFDVIVQMDCDDPHNEIPPIIGSLLD